MQKQRVKEFNAVDIEITKNEKQLENVKPKFEHLLGEEQIIQGR